jgi:membrane-associated phospholipid phosphatase
MIVRFPKKIRETFFLDHMTATLLWTLLFVLICYLFIDVPLAQYFEHLSKPLEASANFLTNLIDPKYQLYVWPILYFFFRFLFKRELLGNRCLLILISISMSNLFTEVLKKMLGRARPELLFSQGQYGFTFLTDSNLYSSFPSGHACTIGAICGAFACFYPRLWPPLLLLSLVLAFTRVILTMHFLSDIIGGVVIGLLIAQWIYKVMKKDNVLFSRRFYGTPF